MMTLHLFTKTAPRRSAASGWRGASALVVLALMASGTVLFQAPAHAATNNPDWHVALQQATKRADLGQSQAADEARSQAERRRADGLLAGAPSAEGLYRSDRPMTNLGAVEMELGVSVPLRRPGQTTAWKTLADRWSDRAQVRSLSDQLTVAGQLRSAAWDWRAAQVELEAARTRLAQMERDQQIVLKQIRLGEAAKVDRLAVDARLLEVRQQVTARKADVAAAEARWQRLTGLKQLPTDLIEQPSLPTGPVTREYLLKHHPMLREIAAQVGVDAAQLAAERAAGAGSPELGLGVKRDRGDRNSVYDNSLMLTFRLPFGGERYRAPQLAELSQQRARNLVALTRTATDIESEVAGLRARIEGWQTRVVQLQQRADLTQHQLDLMQKAQRLGEIDWSRLLDFERQAAEAHLGAQLAKVSLERDQSSLSQALGDLPGRAETAAVKAP